MAINSIPFVYRLPIHHYGKNVTWDLPLMYILATLLLPKAILLSGYTSFHVSKHVNKEAHGCKCEFSFYTVIRMKGVRSVKTTSAELLVRMLHICFYSTKAGTTLVLMGQVIPCYQMKKIGHSLTNSIKLACKPINVRATPRWCC